MGAESLGRLWGREEPSMKGGAKFSGLQGGFTGPGRGAGLLENAGSSSAIYWCRSPSQHGRTSLSWVLLFEVADEEFWGSLSENFWMAFMTTLTVDERAYALSFSKRSVCGWKAAAVVGAAAERTPKYFPWVRWGL